MDKDDQIFADMTTGEKATFGMGCFWGPDCAFGCIPGIFRVKVGYCGGTGKNPTFKKIGDFIEAIEIEFNSQIVSYNDLLKFFWRNHDSTKIAEKSQHRSVIFYKTPDQKRSAEQLLTKQENPKIVTQILPATEFFIAEDYHQKHALQQHPDIVAGLKIPQNRLSKSHIATRLNGYVSGCGTIEGFDAEKEDFGLSQEVETLVRDLIDKNKNSGCVVCAKKENQP